MDDEDDELTIVVRAAAGASALERDGLLHRLEESVAGTVSELIVEGYVTKGSTDPEEIRLVIAAAELASPEILSLVGDSVADLLDDPELAGWGPYSVNVTDEVLGVPVTIDWDNLPDGIVEELPDEDDEDDSSPEALVDDFDVQAARQRLEQDAALVANGLQLSWLTSLDLPAPQSQSGTAEQSQSEAGEEAAPEIGSDAAALQEARYAAGAIFQASVVVLDHLFMDLQTLNGEPHGATVADIDDTAFFVLHDLPARYAHRYDSLFAQEFIVALVDVTRRFTAGWEPLACVAQELALRIILNSAQFQLELAEITLDEGWRSTVEDALFEDLDHEMLYDASLDGIEDDSESLAELRTAPLAFADWFTPFHADRPLPPYLLDESGRLGDEDLEDWDGDEADENGTDDADLDGDEEDDGTGHTDAPQAGNP